MSYFNQGSDIHGVNDRLAIIEKKMSDMYLHIETNVEKK